LYSLEFRTANHIFVALWKSRSKCQCCRSSLWWSGMCCKRTRNKSRLLLILGFQFLKHGCHGAWVVTSCIHVLHAKLVSFLFSSATEFHEDSQQTDARGILINHSGNPTEEY